MYCSGLNVINVATGVYGTKRETSGLNLPATSTFQPIGALSTRIHVTASAALFVHYQVTAINADFWTKLIVNYFKAGSLVHSGDQQNYKVATGYWVANVDPGYYAFEIHYKSSASFSLTAGYDWQTSVINIMWFDGMHTVSDGVKCYPKPTINSFNILSPVQNLEALLHTPWNTVILAAYQTSIYTSSTSGSMMTRMNVNDQQIKSTTMINQGSYIELNGLWMKYLPDGDYHFGLTYRNRYSSYFEDCRNSYTNNKNLYAMTLPSSRCSVVANVEPTSFLYLSPSSWINTDLSYKFTLSQTNHVIVRYQISGPGRSTYTVTRLSINSVPQPHTASIRGSKAYSGNSGFWQGVLSSGTYTITVQHRSGGTYYHYVAGPSYEEYTRAMDIVRCS